MSPKVFEKALTGLKSKQKHDKVKIFGNVPDWFRTTPRVCQGAPKASNAFQSTPNVQNTLIRVSLGYFFSTKFASVKLTVGECLVMARKDRNLSNN